MATVLVELLTSMAPEAAQLIDKLQKAKMNTNQTLMALLALNLEQMHKTTMLLTQLEDNTQEIRNVNQSICNLSGVLAKKGIS